MREYRYLQVCSLGMMCSRNHSDCNRFDGFHRRWWKLFWKLRFDLAVCLTARRHNALELKFSTHQSQKYCISLQWMKTHNLSSLLGRISIHPFTSHSRCGNSINFSHWFVLWESVRSEVYDKVFFFYYYLLQNRTEKAPHLHTNHPIYTYTPYCSFRRIEMYNGRKKTAKCQNLYKTHESIEHNFDLAQY